jgi:hypothetical protein
VVVTQEGKPGHRLLQQNVTLILDSFLTTKTTANSLSQIARTVYGANHVGRCYDKADGKSGKNASLTLEGVSLADLDDVDVLDPLLRFAHGDSHVGRPVGRYGKVGDRARRYAGRPARQRMPLGLLRSTRARRQPLRSNRLSGELFLYVSRASRPWSPVVWTRRAVVLLENNATR